MCASQLDILKSAPHIYVCNIHYKKKNNHKLAEIKLQFRNTLKEQKFWITLKIIQRAKADNYGFILITLNKKLTD